MFKNFNLTIITPGSTIYNGLAQSLVLPGQDGSFGVLASHAPLISLLRKGTLKFKDDRSNFISIRSLDDGLAKISNNTVTILLNSAEKVS